MKINLNTRLLSLLLTVLVLMPTMMFVLPIFAVAAEDVELTTYVLDFNELELVSASTDNAGKTSPAGTDKFFTLHFGPKTKIDTSKDKKWSDGYGTTDTETLINRFNLQGDIELSSPVQNAISFTTISSGKIKIWWVNGGADRELGLYDQDGNLVAQTNEKPTSDYVTYLSEFSFDKEGTYYLGGISNGSHIFKVEVTTQTLPKPPRADWSTVEAPVLTSVKASATGSISVEASGFVNHDGADYLLVSMFKDGKLVTSAKSDSIKSDHSFIFYPIESGNYTFVAALVREGEEHKTSDSSTCTFKLPLQAPFITNIKNLGNGNVSIAWNPVKEAVNYYLKLDGGSNIKVTGRSYDFSNLSLGEHTIQITANSKTAGMSSEVIKFTVTEEPDHGWNFVVYGPSAKDTNTSHTVNNDGSVTINSTGGKIQPTGADGLGFYFTAIPTDQNFTFRVNITVDSWKFDNGQEGFGLMVTDHVPSASYNDSADFWTNQYQAAVTKIEYRAEATDEDCIIYPSDSLLGSKYTMKLGIGSISKIGIDQSIIDRTTLGETGIIVGQNGYLKTVIQPLDTTLGRLGRDQGTYNIIGNFTGTTPEGTMDGYLKTNITLEIQKNNTGYFITYYNQKGEVERQIKNYDQTALEKFDSDYVYVGMFAARNAKVTFKDISLELIDEKNDKPAEERPIEYIIPKLTVTSANTSSSMIYNLIADTNLDGKIEARLNNKLLPLGTDENGNPVTSIDVKKFERFSTIIDLSEYGKYGENDFRVYFTPDPDQEMEPYTQISSTNAVISRMSLMIYRGNFHRKNVYVSPTGLYNGTGSKENPYDLVTALGMAVPGQTIILMEGRYEFVTGITIQRGINGTEDAPIRLIADPEAKTRPVIDFKKEGSGILHGGNWWYFYGFDVTNSLDGQKGFQVSGNNNVLDQINTYYNGNTGIQLSRYNGVDLYKDQWPANNLILNCTSYGNADGGHEDADGFAAKLTIGDGNVFDGCVAYNNADDGWDLYAKVATGPIGTVVIRNCVAYANGYLPITQEMGKGDGNGFKLGGDSLSGYHQLINCIAFNNKSKGIDANSCPDIIVKNCISYNNASYNVSLYTKTAPHTDFVAQGVISFNDETAYITHKGNTENTEPMIEDELKPKGNQDNDKFLNSSCYYWNGSSSTNTDGKSIGANIFVSLEFKGITRNADGTINMNGFLELNVNAPSNVGTTGASTPSYEIVLVDDIPHEYSESWTNTDIYVHWHECACGDKYAIEEHTFEMVIDSEPTATKPGYRHNECTVCGHKRPQIEIPALGGADDSINGGMNNGEAPEIVDIASFFAWLWHFISKFFASLFG